MRLTKSSLSVPAITDVAVAPATVHVLESNPIQFKVEASTDWPDWMTKVDFGGLKQKLLASIVAIAAIQVLKAFMNIDAVFDPQKMAWSVGVLLVFIVSALLLALTDRWGAGHGSG